MAELEEKLNAILNDPQAMGQILSTAKALSAQSEGPDEVRQDTSPPLADNSDPLSLLSQLDPKLLQLGMRLLSEYTGGDDRKAALLAALKPFLKPERQAKIDQAVKIAKLAKVIRAAFQIFQEQREEAEEDV